MITPAISVLSAVEGLTIAEPSLQPLVIPISIAILVGLFLAQSRGTATVGGIFGPVILVYLAALAVLGLSNIVEHPEIVAALSPAWAGKFFLANPKLAFLALGSVFLAVTGAETLYADMGHFGRKAIGWSWLTLVYPCLMLNYLGQGALLLGHPAAAANPFYLMAPEWARLPLVAIATAATIIASQAVISGAFSVTHQAVQLGFLPRLKTEHTSEKALGQIYIPAVNWGLMIMVILLVLGFRESGRLASAYGIAVTGTMLITTVMLGVLVFQVWRWNRLLATAAIGLFLLVDSAYFASNITKIPDGGWFPLLVAAISFTVLTTWAKGRALMRERLQQSALPLAIFIKSAAASVHRVRGTSVFLSTSADVVPAALLHNLKHNQVLHERVLILNVKVEEVPHVPLEKRVDISELGARFLPGDPALRIHAGGRHPARPCRNHHLRRAVRDDEHQFLPRPAEAGRRGQASGHGAVAREIVRLAAQELGKRDGILQAADQPGGRARQPAPDLAERGAQKRGAPAGTGAPPNTRNVNVPRLSSRRDDAKISKVEFIQR